MMTTFIIHRMLHGAVILVFASVIIYFLLTTIPGGPLDELRLTPTPKLSPAEICQLGNLMGLNEPGENSVVDGKPVFTCRPYPWYQRYARWLFDPDKTGGLDLTLGPLHIHGAGILTGNWGVSMSATPGQPVM